MVGAANGGIDMLKALSAVVLLAMAQPALAANWVHVATSNDGNADYIDTQSLAVHGKYRTVWTKSVYKTPQAPKYGAYDLIFEYFDCSERVSAVKSGVTYNTSGVTVTSSSATDAQLNFTPIVPESIADAESRYVCK